MNLMHTKGEERERKKGKGQKFSVYGSTKLKGLQPPSHIFYIGQKHTRLNDLAIENHGVVSDLTKRG